VDAVRLTALRHALIEDLQRRGIITDDRIAAAFAAVPRDRFLPGLAAEQVYRDEAIVTKVRDDVALSSSSQPAMMAIQLQQLLLEPGHRVLEIGAGTGYNAALLRFIVGASGRVTTVDVDDDIVTAARAQIAAAGYDDVRVVLGDGGYGHAPDAPYDRIILTVGAADLLPAWIEQLRPDGVIVLPLQLGAGMFSVALRKLPNGTLLSESLTACGFIRLRGAFASVEQTLRVAGWDVVCEPGPRLDPARLAALLGTPLGMPLGTRPLPPDANEATLFLAFCAEPLAQLYRVTAANTPPTEGARHALLDTAAMSACLLPPRWAHDTHGADASALLFGSPAAYERINALLARWATHDKPRPDTARLLVLPPNTPPPAGTLALQRTHATLLLAGRDGRPLT